MNLPKPSKPAAKPAAKPAPVKAAKKEGEVTFKEGTKRRACFDALIRKQGCTLADGEKLVGWAQYVVASEFREVAKLTNRKLAREGNVYRLEGSR